MRTCDVPRRAAPLAALALLMAWLPTLAAPAAELAQDGGAIPEFMGAPPSSDDNAPPSAEGVGEMAAGAAEDTLKACLARIPKIASAGQRMLAEQSCEQEAGIRRWLQAAPEF